MAAPLAGRARCSDGKPGKGVTHEFPALRAGNNSTSPHNTAGSPLCCSAPGRAKKLPTREEDVRGRNNNNVTRGCRERKRS